MEIEAFLDYWLRRKKASPRTIRSYGNDLRLFESFMQERNIHRITQVNHQVVDAYIDLLKQKPNPRFGRVGLKDASIERRLASLSSFFEWVRATTNPKLKNPLKDLVHRWQENDTPKPVDEITLDQLIAGIDNLRDRLLITLLLATGLRAFEVHQLNRDTIALESTIDSSGEERLGGVGQVLGKGGKVRPFYVDAATSEVLAEYLEARKDSDPALFLSEQRKRLSIRAMQYTLAAWCKKLGLRHVHPHELRHSYATRLANAHIDSMILKALMGHRDLRTTQRYFKLNDSTLAQGYFSAMEFINGASQIGGGAE